MLMLFGKTHDDVHLSSPGLLQIHLNSENVCVFCISAQKDSFSNFIVMLVL